MTIWLEWAIANRLVGVSVRNNFSTWQTVRMAEENGVELNQHHQHA